LAHTKSAKKSIGIIAERRMKNRSINRSLKTNVQKAESLIDDGEQQLAEDAVLKAKVALDKAAQKGIIHKKNAAHRKSNLMKRLNAAFKSGS